MKRHTSSQVKDCVRQWWLKVLSCCDKEAEEYRKPIQIGHAYDFRHVGGANGPSSFGLSSTATSTYLVPRAAPPACVSSISEIPSTVPARPSRTDTELPSATTSTQASSLADITSKSATGDRHAESVTPTTIGYSREEVRATEV